MGLSLGGGVRGGKIMGGVRLRTLLTLKGAWPSVPGAVYMWRPCSQAEEGLAQCQEHSSTGASEEMATTERGDGGTADGDGFAGGWCGVGRLLKDSLTLFAD